MAGGNFIAADEGGSEYPGKLTRYVAITCIMAAMGGGWLPQSYAILVVLCICVFVAAFAFSWGPLGWLIPSEISPLEVRSAAQSVTVSMNMLFTFGVAQVFLKVLCWMKFGLFIFFAAFVFIMTLFVYFYVPETKNIPIEEMSRVLREHWYWKNYMDEQSPAKEVVF
uniref:Sugar transport protein 12 n=1 Tax=Solanum tuberosum TaxID=4113 RepID=M1BYY1_SOLTU